MHETELFDAIRAGDAATVARLLGAEPGLSLSRQNGISPILFAVYHGHAGLAQLLIDHGASPSFCEACALGDQSLALRLLAADPSLLDSFSDDGFPALGLAIFFRHPALARELIERGADVDAAARNAASVVPIHAAAAVRDIETVRLLIARGANVNAMQQMHYTALHTAAQHGDEAMVDLLLAAGADPHVVADDGKSPAGLASAQGHAVLAERLSS